MHCIAIVTSIFDRFTVDSQYLNGRLNEIFEGFDSAINFYRRQRSRSLIHKTGQSRHAVEREYSVTSFSTHRNSARMYDPIFVAMIKIARFILWIYIRVKCNRTSLGESFQMFYVTRDFYTILCTIPTICLQISIA